MDSTQQIWAAVLASSGLFAFLGVVANGVLKHVDGTAGREKVRNTGLKQQRDEAWALVRTERARGDSERDRADLSDERADIEAFNRRLTEEYASQLRRDCTEHGMQDRELRPWPPLKKLPKEQEHP
ncbi:hypothetical protein [Arthrobacter sp. PsM3]|uniref:hypothetical protein n=1 Tax=Arthrobacter sp. PsM3 TaxID=3030531 RepID=UPI00263A72F9|nr:hypothetical protein [Arthrobacter sp. PsM3]MDN4646462.1 hypothetical protein [Arthrobacter sp. PsM3]